MEFDRSTSDILQKSLKDLLQSLGCSEDVCVFVSEILAETPSFYDAPEKANSARDLLFLEGEFPSYDLEEELKKRAQKWNETKCSGIQAALHVKEALYQIFARSSQVHWGEKENGRLARWLNEKKGANILTYLTAPDRIASAQQVAELAVLADQDFVSIIDLGKLSTLADEDVHWSLLCNPSRISHDGEEDPQDLRFWLCYMGHRDSCLRIYERFPPNVSQQITLGIVNAYRCRLRRSSNRTPDEYERTLAVCLLEKYDDILWGSDDSPWRQKARRAWLVLAFIAHGNTQASPLKKRRQRIVSAAMAELGSLRPLFRQADKEESRKEFDHESPALDRFQAFASFLCQVDLSAGLKSLLLCFRSLSAQGVDSELRWWHADFNDPKDRTWCCVAEEIANAIHQNSNAIQAKDPEMTVLRSDLAAFCLERLKTRKTKAKSSNAEESNSNEPDPIWRKRMILAAQALYVNPGGKGHNILNWAAKSDPDESVRELAKKVYPFFRHGPALPNNMSPRRALFHAFWHFRWAHLESWDIPIVEWKAQRTLAAEVRRTAG